MTDGNQSKQQIQLGIIGTELAVEKLHWPALERMPERIRAVAFANRTWAKAAQFLHLNGVSMDGNAVAYGRLGGIPDWARDAPPNL